MSVVSVVLVSRRPVVITPQQEQRICENAIRAYFFPKKVPISGQSDAFHADKPDSQLSAARLFRMCLT